MSASKPDAKALAERLRPFLQSGGAIVLSALDAVDRVARNPRSTVVANRGTERVLSHALAAQAAAMAKFTSNPFVAYVQFTANGEITKALISRGTAPDHAPANSECEFISYLAPRGRIAALNVGQEIRLATPGGTQRIVLLEQDRFLSVKRAHWDAEDNVFESLQNTAERFPSLRALVELHDATAAADDRTTVNGTKRRRPSGSRTAETDSTAADFSSEISEENLTELLAAYRARSAEKAAEATERRAAAARTTRGILASIDLRDQAILDQTQDTVFRLPLRSTIALTGAPGTGKTTTLIKRIAQKSQIAFLTVEEKATFDGPAEALFNGSSNSWVLFTPNDLLKGYVRDAIGREGVRISTKSLRTWHDQQRVLARDVFGFFGDPTKARFVPHRQSLVRLDNHEILWEYVALFEAHWTERYASQFESRFTRIEALGAGFTGRKVAVPLDPSDRLSTAFHRYGDRMEVLSKDVQELRRRTGGRPVEVALTSSELNATGRAAAESRDEYLDEVLKHIASMFPAHFGVRVEDALRKRRVTTLRRWMARAVADAVPPPDVDEETEQDVDVLPAEIVGALEVDPYRSMIQLSREWDSALRAARQLTRGIDALFELVVSSYARFRRQMRADEKLVSRFELSPLPEVNESSVPGAAGETSDGNQNQRRRAAEPMTDAEADLLLFALLRLSHDIMRARPALLWRAKESNVLTSLHRELRAIVTVDEAPDFSPVQLGCMYHLTHPAVSAFSMSGDLMQRTTRHGLQSWDACRVFAEDLEVHEFRTVYRQSKKLTRIAAELYRHVMREEPPFESPYSESTDPDPLLATIQSNEAEVSWVAQRIREIQRLCGRLPSIGVFVPTEAQVVSTAARLADALYGDAVDVQACENGGNIGSGDRVRVFSVQHIKGIEFQAVLMLQLDRVEGFDEHLVARYLYLGLTRAVEFLGVTVRTALPPALATLSGQFSGGTWTSVSAPSGRS